MKLEGVLVDLVPLGERFDAQEHTWENGPAAYWGDAGDRHFVTRAQVQRNQKQRAENHSEGFVGFGIQTKDGTPIGLIAAGDLRGQHRVAYLGAQIGDPAYWGGGYGTDALLLFVDYLFEWLDLRRVWLSTMSLNARVIRQMEKVGFRLEVRQREDTLADGARADMLSYGLLREEWPGRAALVERLGLRAPRDHEGSR